MSQMPLQSSHLSSGVASIPDVPVVPLVYSGETSSEIWPLGQVSQVHLAVYLLA